MRTIGRDVSEHLQIADARLDHCTESLLAARERSILMPQARSTSAVRFEMQRAAIKVRFPTELKNEKSVEVVPRLCRSAAT